MASVVTSTAVPFFELHPRKSFICSTVGSKIASGGGLTATQAGTWSFRGERYIHIEEARERVSWKLGERGCASGWISWQVKKIDLSVG